LKGLEALPQGHGPVRARIDSGFESLAMFQELRRRGVGFSCSLKRSPALHRLRLELPTGAWRAALQMSQAEIAETAETTYMPQGRRHQPLPCSGPRPSPPPTSACVCSPPAPDRAISPPLPPLAGILSRPCPVGNLRATETAVVSLDGRYLADVDAQQLTFTIIGLTSGKVVAVEHRAVRGFPRADDSRVVESSLFQLQPT
jgi:hypothetical protein